MRQKTGDFEPFFTYIYKTIKEGKTMQQYINPYRLWVGAFIPNWLCCRYEISQGAKLCYARLAQYAGKDGSCYPSQESLSAELGVSERTVRDYIGELKQEKLIDVKQRGLQHANEYFFLVHPWMELAAPMPKQQEVVANTQSGKASNSKKKSSPEDYIDAHKIYECWNAKKQESDDIIICTESFNGIKHRLKGAINKRNPEDICIAIDNYVSAIKSGYKARYTLIEFLYKIDKFMPQNFKASNFSYNGSKGTIAKPANSGAGEYANIKIEKWNPDDDIGLQAAGNK
jgi:hypothetical protein